MFFGPALSLGLCLAPAAAAAEDDLDAVRALADAGEAERVREACDRLRKDPAVGTARLDDLDWLVISALLRRAERETDPSARSAVSARALDALDAYLRDFPEGRHRDEADLAAADTLLERAARLSADPAGTARERALLAALSAASSLDRLLEGWRSDPLRPQPLLLRARYLRVSATFQRALLLPPTDALRPDLLARAGQEAEELATDLGSENLASYDLALLRARALDAAGDFTRAAAACEPAILLLLREDSARTRPVVARAYAFKCACLLRAGELVRAVKTAEELRRAWAGRPLLELPEGRDALLQEARALWLLGDPTRAFARALEVARQPGRPPLDAYAFLAKHARFARALGVAVPPETLLAGAEAQSAAGDWRAALESADAAYQLAGGAACTGPVAAAALHRRALAYASLGLTLEAAIAFGRVAHEFPASPLAASASAREVEALAGLPPDEFSRAEFDRALAGLRERFPNSPEVRGALFLSARRSEEAARAGQCGFLEAARAYDEVPVEAGENHDRARFRAASCRFREAESRQAALARLPEGSPERDAADRACRDLYRAAADALEACLRSPHRGAAAGEEPDVSAAELARERADRLFRARETLARIALERLGEPARAEAAFHDAEVEYASDPERLVRAWSLVLQARLDGGDLAGARSLFVELERRFAEVQPARVARVARALGFACRRAAEGGGGKGGGPEAAAAAAEKRRAAEYFAVWAELSLRVGAPLTPAEAVAAAELNLADARVHDDPTPAGRAEVLFRAVLDGRPAGPLPRERWSLVRDLAESLGLRNRWDEAVRLLEAERAAQPDVASLPEALGRAYLALGDRGRSECRAKALDLAADLLARSPAGSRPWWSARVLAAEALSRLREFSRLRALLRDLRLGYPEFDGGVHGAREALERLEKSLPAGGAG